MNSPLDFSQPLPPHRPFDYSRYLFPEGVVRLLQDDPNIRAAYRAGLKVGFEMAIEWVRGADVLTPDEKRRAGEIADRVTSREFGEPTKGPEDLPPAA